MRYYVTDSPPARDYVATGRFGLLIGPHLHIGKRWIAEAQHLVIDSGCYGNYPGDHAYLTYLKNLDHRDRVQFACAPDVVGDAHATLERSTPWFPVLRTLGYPVGYVAQDGHQHLPVPWDDIDALFIGGTTDFKMGPVPLPLIREAQRRGKWTHMGRVNTLNRIRRAQHLRLDSVDGTVLAYGSGDTLGQLLRWTA